jgi:hypothetical protein
VDVRLNGAATWTPVAVGAEHTVTGLLEGTHVLEARARFVCMRMRGQWVRRRSIPSVVDRQRRTACRCLHRHSELGSDSTPAYLTWRVVS